MGATRRNLQAQLKSLEKIRNIKSANQYENYPKKSMVITLKVERIQKFVWTELAGSTENVKKNCRNIKSTNQNINVPKKKYVLYLKSGKEAKIRMRANRRNSPRELKKQ
jgi:hypothetical protein